MSSFDAERGVMVLEPEQWDVLQRMVTGPIAQRANYAQGAWRGWRILVSSTLTGRHWRPRRSWPV